MDIGHSIENRNRIELLTNHGEWNFRAHEIEVTPGAGRDSCLNCVRAADYGAMHWTKYAGWLMILCVWVCARSKRLSTMEILRMRNTSSCKLDIIRSEQDEHRSSAWKRHTSNSSLTFVWRGHAKYLIFALTQNTNHKWTDIAERRKCGWVETEIILINEGLRNSRIAWFAFVLAACLNKMWDWTGTSSKLFILTAL